MSDKSVREAKAERFGKLIVVRMTGGPDCLWMNMYLDEETGQMTCDSDIGSYAYHWGRQIGKRENWTDFCCKWLSDEEWLLRKCIGERHEKKRFYLEKTVMELRQQYDELHNGDDESTVFGFEDVLDDASAYDNADQFSAVLSTIAEERGVDLPDEWWNCIFEDYTPWQKRFAEICREVIVPAIRAMDERCCG